MCYLNNNQADVIDMNKSLVCRSPLFGCRLKQKRKLCLEMIVEKRFQSMLSKAWILLLEDLISFTYPQAIDLAFRLVVVFSFPCSFQL